MKINQLCLLIIVGISIYSCKGDTDLQGSSNNSTPILVSGKVEGGYRHIPVIMTTDSSEITVYRGDYIKFNVDDKGDPRVDYQLDITELGISSILKDNTIEQPFFKMKKSGKFEFNIGTHPGTIEVVELQQSNYSELSTEEAWGMLQKNPPFLLDVRTSGEYSQGFLKGAVLLPLQDLQSRVAELERYKNQPILVYCATGNRSTTASKILLDQGFKNVMNLRMGIMGWASKGYNIEFQ